MKNKVLAAALLLSFGSIGLASADESTSENTKINPKLVALLEAPDQLKENITNMGPENVQKMAMEALKSCESDKCKKSMDFLAGFAKKMIESEKPAEETKSADKTSSEG